MNVRKYIKIFFHTFFATRDPAKEEEEEELNNDNRPTTADKEFGLVIIGILIFVLIFLLLN